MIKQCKQCGKDFEATMRQKFCPECKKIRQREQKRRYFNSELGQKAHERYNAKRRKNPKLIKPKPKPKPEPKPLPKFNMCDICGKKFKPAFPREHFCSDKCRFNSPLARAVLGNDVDLYR